LGTGVAGGVAGIVLDPYKGAKKKGIKGFFKGVGTGLTGVVGKTAAGGMGLVTQTLKGIGNTASFVLDEGTAPVPPVPLALLLWFAFSLMICVCFPGLQSHPARPPRAIKADKVLRPYNQREAERAASERATKAKNIAKNIFG